jgi:hypothetical protein
LRISRAQAAFARAANSVADSSPGEDGAMPT